MSAAKLDGAALAKRIKSSLKPRIQAVTAARDSAPSLMVVGTQDADRPANSYRRAQLKACAEAGIHAKEFLSRWSSPEEVRRLVAERPEFDAVVLDLPFPGLSVAELLSQLPPDRDAESLSPENFGRLFQIKAYGDIERDQLLAPCTAAAVAELLRLAGVPLPGKRAVVLGRSNIVGKPAAHLLTAMDLTATLCHSKTPGLAEIVAQADVVVAAIGQARFVKAGWIKPGAIVIDAGINEAGGKICGDVDPGAADRAGFMTPVPGGVGPVTTALLLSNVVTLAERRLRVAK